MVVLDTSLLIDILRGNPAVSHFIEDLDKSNEEKCVAAVSAMELYFGALQLNKKDKINGVISLLGSLIVLNFDFKSAIEASEIKNELVKKGLIIDLEDIMIAGIAKTNEQTLITKNIKHFERIEGLEIETYQ